MLDFDYEKVTLEDAKKALEGSPKDQPESAWTVKRRPPAAEKLSAFTATWILELPAAVLRPLQLAKLYPRIANDLCRHWKQPAQWDSYTADLLIVRRGGRGRQGFPAQVASELIALIEHHATLYPLQPLAPAKTEAPAWGFAPVQRRG